MPATSTSAWRAAGGCASAGALMSLDFDSESVGASNRERVVAHAQLDGVSKRALHAARSPAFREPAPSPAGGGPPSACPTRATRWRSPRRGRGQGDGDWAWRSCWCAKVRLDLTLPDGITVGICHGLHRTADHAMRMVTTALSRLPAGSSGRAIACGPRLERQPRCRPPEIVGAQDGDRRARRDDLALIGGERATAHPTRTPTARRAAAAARRRGWPAGPAARTRGTTRRGC